MDLEDILEASLEPSLVLVVTPAHLVKEAVSLADILVQPRVQLAMGDR